MRPVMMTSYGWPDGNCFAACVASILEVELADLPCGPCAPKAPDEAIDAWVQPWNEWFVKRGLYLASCDAWWPEKDGCSEMVKIPGYTMLSCAVLGAPPNADGTPLRHAVVAFDGQVVHNPQPGMSSPMDGLWPMEYHYFIATDAARMVLVK